MPTKCFECGKEIQGTILFLDHPFCGECGERQLGPKPTDSPSNKNVLVHDDSGTELPHEKRSIGKFRSDIPNIREKIEVRRIRKDKV